MEGNYSIRKFFKKLFCHEGGDNYNEFRNYHFVVATLIAAVTFQAGVNPPGGVWQDTTEPHDQSHNETGRAIYALNQTASRHEAGRAIYASNQTAFYVFLTFNTLALSSSVLLLMCLTLGFPFFLKVVVAVVSMVITYGASIFAITPKDMVKFRYLLSVAGVPVVVRFVTVTCKYVMWKRSERKK